MIQLDTIELLNRERASDICVVNVDGNWRNSVPCAPKVWLK